jgi:hypothetical protein
LLLRGEATQSFIHQNPLHERGPPTFIDRGGSGTMYTKTTGGKADNGPSTLPTSANSAHTLRNKYYHHQRKSTGTEENFALTYPIKILLAEDNVCK